MRAFFKGLFAGRERLQGPRPIRDRGRPPSPNGASSFHLIWQVPAGSITAVRATLRVVLPPATADLYFFALQASFSDGRRDHGGAHLGLQWNARHPGSTAANWGGYAAQELGGGVLEGTRSELPSRPSDENTRDFPWQPGRAYRLEIAPGDERGWWRGTITDGGTNKVTEIRQLQAGGNLLRAPMTWAEVFAPCDAPPVEIEWGELEVRTGGYWSPISAVVANYQDFSAGGCTNTNSRAAGDFFAQRTTTARSTENGALIRIGS